jgi:hypothetical protein
LAFDLDQRKMIFVEKYFHISHFLSKCFFLKTFYSIYRVLSKPQASLGGVLGQVPGRSRLVPFRSWQDPEQVLGESRIGPGWVLTGSVDLRMRCSKSENDLQF